MKSKIKLRLYDVIARAVEEGAALGWRRAHKHTDTPSDDLAVQEIENAVMNELCEVIDFGE